MTSNDRRGFTLVELLVVVAMISVILGAISTSVTAAQNRARVQKATSDVKVISQAILAYENYERGNAFKLPTMEKVDADMGSIGFLIGQGETAQSGGKIPALLMASLQGGGKMRDPWGTPYKITIREGAGRASGSTAGGSLQTGYFLPNFYRLKEGERSL